MKERKNYYCMSGWGTVSQLKNATNILKTSNDCKTAQKFTWEKCHTQSHTPTKHASKRALKICILEKPFRENWFACEVWSWCFRTTQKTAANYLSIRASAHIYMYSLVWDYVVLMCTHCTTWILHHFRCKRLLHVVRCCRWSMVAIRLCTCVSKKNNKS